jgi:hypothetical protein
MSPRLSFALFVIVSASYANAVAQTHVTHANSPAKAALSKPAPCQSVSITTSEMPLTPIQAPAAPAPRTCDHLEQDTKLRSAQFELDNLRLENAVIQFSPLISSCDDGVRGESALGVKRAHALMGDWWWLEGRYVPPLRWYHHPRFWQAVWHTLLIIVVILLLLSPFFYGTEIRLFQWPTKSLTLVLQKLRPAFLVDDVPRASIMTPAGLTDPTQAKLFASMLESSSDDVRRVLERAGGGLQVRATALLALPSATTSELVDNLPKVKGVDVAGFAKFVLYLKRYLGWRVESEIGYCPPTKSSDGAQSNARIVANASLRHAFWVRGGPWPVQRVVQHDYDIDGVAFAIAARIMGFYAMRGNRAR